MDKKISKVLALEITEMQMKITLIFHLIHGRMAQVNKTINYKL